jgi:ribosomal protein S7
LKSLYKRDQIFYRKIYKVQNIYNINSSMYIYFMWTIYFRKFIYNNFNQFFVRYFLSNIVQNNNMKVISKSIFNKLIATFMADGYKLRSYNNMHYAFCKLYSLLNIKMFHNLLKNYVYFKEFLFNNSLNDNLNNIYTVLNWLFFWYQPIFAVKCSKVPKKYRKKLKKKFTFSTNYINVIKRRTIALRWIFYFSNTFNSFKMKNRLLLLFSDLIFNFKDSVIYKRKIKMYKKVFKL